MARQVLIVDDDPVQRRLLQAQVERMGLRAIQCDGGEAALEIFRGPCRSDIGAMVLDLMMPDKSGLEVLEDMRRTGIEVPTVVQTAKGSIETVVSAMRAGAFDFVVKPVSQEKLQSVLNNAVRMGEALGARAGKAAEPRRGRLEGHVSLALRPALEQARKAATSAIPVLVEGETGVGKEWLARAIHETGARARKPFVAVNCGALPATLVESILFGHEKGAFTDATERHTGKFMEADGGTLFLDEIAELAPQAQVKLLRVLQDGEVDPVGGRKPIRADIRLVSATNRDLAAAVRAGSFRQDLYYRLNVLAIRVPPLRERRSEIVSLAEHFLKRFVSLERTARARRLGESARDLLHSYDWPGNIRQLENVVHRAVVLAESEILEAEDFPQLLALRSETQDGPAPNPRASVFPATPAGVEAETARSSRLGPAIGSHALSVLDEGGDIRTVDAVEADLIRLAIRRYDGRISEVARRLGVGRSTLYRKLREYDIPV